MAKNLHILGMYVVDRIAKKTQRLERIDPLPEKMGGIEIATHHRASFPAQSHQGFGIENNVPRMHLET